MKLSVLIPSVFERREHLDRITKQLLHQIGDNKDVELVVLLENKRRTTGQKREQLKQLSKGDYIAFLDDDDRIADDYIKELLDAIHISQAELIVFDVFVTIDKKPSKITRSGIEYKDSEDANYYYRKPNHIMCYKRDFAIKYPYLNLSFGEDAEWANRISKDIQKQYRIEKVLYYYDCIKKPQNWYYKAA